MIPPFKIIAAARLQAQDGRHQNFQSSKGIPRHPLLELREVILFLFTSPLVFYPFNFN
jgi:hypothetical protein